MPELWPQIDWLRILSNLIQLAIAYLLAIPVGWDREREARGAGLRTFPLVAVGSCGFLLLGLETLGTAPEPQARVLYGLITGIGFIGGGAILKQEGGVRGMSTAASIWITGAVGAAVAWGQYEIAITLSLVTFLTLYFVASLKRMVHKGPGD
ncbi:MgtC/SapB family protein [Thiohalorhabdus methylotrophus]|uniref:Protein MgtC n=1 Tax=Thiohalorhabdus methylotrophus TaxID=3242694 RepID=A0ABV4TTS2_9GAMM